MTGIDSLEYSKYKLVFKNKILHDTSKIQEIKLRENDKVYVKIILSSFIELLLVNIKFRSHKLFSFYFVKPIFC